MENEKVVNLNPGLIVRILVMVIHVKPQSEFHSSGTLSKCPLRLILRYNVVIVYKTLIARS